MSTGLFFGGNAGSDEGGCPEIEVRESPYLHAIWYGHENPERIPDFLKYLRFELLYNPYLTELVQQLTPEDHATLMKVKSESGYWREVEGEKYVQRMADLCAAGAELNPIAVATNYEQIALEHNNGAAARIKNAIQSLSPKGRQAVLDYIEIEITPELEYPRTNSVTLAEDSPKGFQESFAVMCYSIVNQDLPPEIKKAMECHQKQTRQESDRSDQTPVRLFPWKED
jgi:hypothetical protein